jgi:hypothetical protein
MTERKLKRGGAKEPALPLPKVVQEYVNAKAARESFAKREDQMKAILKHALDTEGYEDDRGNRYLDIDGVEGVAAIKHERRVSRGLDEDAARKVADEHGVLAKCIKTIEVFDEDAFVALSYQGKIPESDFLEAYVEREIFAVKVMAP